MLHACQATYMWAHYKWPTQQPYNIWALQIPHIKHASQQPLNIMCYMHAGQHICAPTASVPADWWVIYVCYTHATIRTDMAWDTSDICLLQACHPAISPSPVGLVSNLVIIPGSFCQTHTSHSVIPITTSLPPLCLGSVSTLIPFDCA